MALFFLSLALLLVTVNCFSIPPLFVDGLNHCLPLLSNLKSLETLCANQLVASEFFPGLSGAFQSTSFFTSDNNVDLVKYVSDLLKETPSLQVSDIISQYMADNPDLKLSSSEFLSSTLNKEVVDKFEGVYVEITKRNPELQVPTSKYVSSIIQDEISPRVADLSQRIVTRLIVNPISSTIDAFKSFALNTASAFKESLNDMPQSNQLTSDQSPSLTINLDDFKQSIRNFKSISAKAVSDVGNDLSQESLKALNRAGNTLSLEFAAAGEKLSTNTISFVNSVADAIGEITDGVVNVLPSRSQELIDESLSSTLPSLAKTSSDAAASIVSQAQSSISFIEKGIQEEVTNLPKIKLLIVDQDRLQQTAKDISANGDGIVSFVKTIKSNAEIISPSAFDVKLDNSLLSEKVRPIADSIKSLKVDDKLISDQILRQLANQVCGPGSVAEAYCQLK